ncbi:MAG TPA: xanthine dehydrogenase small subunit, partial [Thalassospira lucentensis]
TVIIGEPNSDGGMAYRTVNACIQFVPTLDGKQLLTVEHLKSKDGNLHPVQQAMVETHGSQCGFCTPGFVMSLYQMWLDGGEEDRGAINDALAGNLCRCTGYGPI